MHHVRKKNVIIILIISFLIAISSALWTHDIANNKEELQSLEFGWPVTYVIQNQEWRDPPYPYKAKFDAPQEARINTVWSGLLIDTVFFVIVISGVTFLFKKA